MKKKTRNKVCTLRINEKQVVLRIKNENNGSHEIISPDVKEPRVLAPLPKLERLKENARFFSRKGLGGSTVKEFMDSYIRGREKEIREEILEIRKSIKRIERSIQCIEIVEKNIEYLLND